MLVIIAALSMLVALLPAAAGAQTADGLPTADDPRVGLSPGFDDAGTAELGLDQVGMFDKRDSPFWDPASIESINVATANSDLAFTGDHAIHGNWRGIQIYNIADPANPTLRTSVLCPGGQGDVNVFGTLMFTSVQDVTGRVDCGAQGAGPADVPNPDRARGVRIWDISDLDNPVQLAVVQTCRGSHTNRLVEDPNDPDHVYIYNNGTSGMRHPAEAGLNCTDAPLTTNPVTDPAVDRWQIEVIKVPLANPAAAAIVNEVRLFQDPATGAFNGLNNTLPGALHPSGVGYSPLPNTNTCHDITVYPEIGLAAGACQGNGLLIDISNPANPVRLDAVSDPNFSYWHSANFNNDGTAVMFTDEWGGGAGARCRASDRLEWGANALFSIDRSGPTPKLEFQSYFKMPAVQTDQENCVAHQANIVPVPGRDILVQAWYQGGISMFDWTDPANPFEIGYFDRGPIRTDRLILGGFWSGYWYNGQIYGGEITRGLDVFDLVPTADLSANEIAASRTVELAEHNAMSMRRIEFTPSFTVTRAFRDQAERAGLAPNHVNNVDRALERAERFRNGPQARAAVANLRAVSNQVRRDAPALADSLVELSNSL